MNDNELLTLLKKEGKCKTNQCLLELVERLAEIMRRKKSMSVYKEQKFIKKLAQAEVPPELEDFAGNENIY